MTSRIRKDPLELIAEQKLLVLAGERGDPLDHALRRRQLEDVQLLIASVRKQAVIIVAQLLTAQGDIDQINGEITDIGVAIAGLSAGIATVADNLSGVAGDLTTVAGDLAIAEDSLAALNAAIPDVIASVAAKRAVAVAAMESSDVSGAPDAGDFNDLHADVAAIRAAIIAIRNA